MTTFTDRKIRRRLRKAVLSVGAAGLFAVIFAAGMPSASAALTAIDKTRFEDANRFYREGKFDQAARIYRGLHAAHPDKAVFAYNLGNSLFRTGDLGGAVLAYERAKIAAPRSSDVRHNLRHVRNLLEFRVEDKRGWYTKAAETFLEWFREDELYLLLALAYFLFAAACVSAVFYRRGEPWGFRRKTLAVFLAAAAVLAGAKFVEARMVPEAVITAREAEVRYGPSVSDQVAFRVGQGIAAYVMDERENWSRIMLVNKETGWVKNSDIALLNIPEPKAGMVPGEEANMENAGK